MAPICPHIALNLALPVRLFCWAPCWACVSCFCRFSIVPFLETHKEHTLKTPVLHTPSLHTFSPSDMHTAAVTERVDTLGKVTACHAALSTSMHLACWHVACHDACMHTSWTHITHTQSRELIGDKDKGALPALEHSPFQHGQVPC